MMPRAGWFRDVPGVCRDVSRGASRVLRRLRTASPNLTSSPPWRQSSSKMRNSAVAAYAIRPGSRQLDADFRVSALCVSDARLSIAFDARQSLKLCIVVMGGAVEGRRCWSGALSGRAHYQLVTPHDASGRAVGLQSGLQFIGDK
jgi:hypothetical protein